MGPMRFNEPKNSANYVLLKLYHLVSELNSHGERGLKQQGLDRGECAAER